VEDDGAVGQLFERCFVASLYAGARLDPFGVEARVDSVGAGVIAVCQMVTNLR
jgi:hypothetical protein